MMFLPLYVCWSVLLAAPDLAPAASLPARPAEQTDPLADDAVVASALDTTLTWKELEPYLLLKRADSKAGRDALLHLAKSRLLEVVAKEKGVEVADAVLDARIAEIEAQLLAAGEREGLAGQMRKARMSAAEFRRYLRLGLQHEILTRRTLGKPDGEAVTAEQQELYLDHLMRERELEVFRAPWKDGVAAKGAGVLVTAAENLLHLRKSLSAEDLGADAYDALLLKRAKARMPDLAPEKFAKAVKDELQRLRDGVAADPAKKGLSLETLRAAQGYLADRLEQDPELQCKALARLWVERSYDDATLKRVYADERDRFDAAYGAAIDTRMIFLRAADFSRETDLRTFKEAEKRLGELQARIKSFEDFERTAKEASEDLTSRERAGRLGWVTVGNTRHPESVRKAVEKELAQRPVLVASSAGSMAGPVRLPNGSALLWLGARRGVPSWEQMARWVQEELRQRFLDETLPREKMVEAFQ